MTAKTHVLGSMSLALGGYILMDKGGLLIPDVEPLIQLGIILPYSVWASTVPDLDQAHDSVAQSSPINLLIQRFFKIVKAGHRSVKSHVAPAFISLAIYLALAFNMIGRNLNGTEITILALAVLGITAGLVSHFLLDKEIGLITTPKKKKRTIVKEVKHDNGVVEKVTTKAPSAKDLLARYKR